ncbi:MAG: PD-(D/E)XK nuclease family protein [Bryobacterales bacterium]|nr:PD-(D/E)XK nuclease family protein [Bryobacterales bacterium]
MTNQSQELISEHDLRDFFSALDFRLDLLDQGRRSLNVYLSLEFNVFDYIDPNENRISQVIADMLNPRGRHGQGKIFLDRFLTVIGQEEQVFRSAQARVHYQTPTTASTAGLIDITIDLADFGVGIENKPWAIEQNSQLERYRRHLADRYGGRFCLVFLEGRGSGPTSISEQTRRELESVGKFRTLHYQPDLRNWIEWCAKESQSDKLRWFLRDFIGYIDREFHHREGARGYD